MKQCKNQQNHYCGWWRGSLSQQN